jgi:hypothetical protein
MPPPPFKIIDNPNTWEVCMTTNKRAILVRLPRYVYSATISPAVAKRYALQQYLQTFFGGSR